MASDSDQLTTDPGHGQVVRLGAPGPVSENIRGIMRSIDEIMARYFHKTLELIFTYLHKLCPFPADQRRMRTN